MRNLLKITVVLILLQNCSYQPSKKIEITPAYIKNDFWKTPFSSFFVIEKMNLMKDSISIKLDSSFNTRILNYLETDTSFIYTFSSNDRSKIIDDTIFFNAPNEGTWITGGIRYNGIRRKTETIGNLQNNCWYKFSELRDFPFYLYVFVDSNGNIHRFDRNLSNF